MLGLQVPHDGHVLLHAAARDDLLPLRDARTYEIAIVIVIAVAAVAGLGKSSRANSWARLVEWDKRRSASHDAAKAAVA
jgi:hypothetical protein